jgi:transcriptional regulator with XRE-family HTH domain
MRRDGIPATTDLLWQQHLRGLGELIKAHRAMNQLSQRELARLADLSDSYMSQLERGRHEPSISVLRSLADHLGIRPDELILYAAGLPMRDEPVSTEDAIRADSRLSATQRTALLAVLDSYVQANESAS